MRARVKKKRKAEREGNEPGENEGGRDREAKVRQRIGDTESQICYDECENGNRNSHRERERKSEKHSKVLQTI